VVFIGEALEPLAEFFAGGFVGDGAGIFRAFQDFAFHKNGTIEAQGQGVPWARIDRHKELLSVRLPKVCHRLPLEVGVVSLQRHAESAFKIRINVEPFEEAANAPHS